jgi:hypothetical protein
MPKGAVTDEAAWERAKGLVHKQYKFKESNPRFYKLAMTIYKNIVGNKPKKKSRSKLESALES